MPARPYGLTRPNGLPTVPAIDSSGASSELSKRRFVSLPVTTPLDGFTYCTSAARNGLNQYAAPAAYDGLEKLLLHVVALPHAAVVRSLYIANPGLPKSTRPVGKGPKLRPPSSPGFGG